jgi:hypothetical protein
VEHPRNASSDASLDVAFGTYRGLIAQIAGQFGNTPVGATESI